jgi:hypothetical protein
MGARFGRAGRNWEANLCVIAPGRRFRAARRPAAFHHPVGAAARALTSPSPSPLSGPSCWCGVCTLLFLVPPDPAHNLLHWAAHGQAIKRFRRGQAPAHVQLGGFAPRAGERRFPKWMRRLEDLQQIRRPVMYRPAAQRAVNRDQQTVPRSSTELRVAEGIR